MQAYLNNPGLKKQTIAAMRQDIKADRLVKGHYWNGNNGCFVGCVIRGESPNKFEIQLGIPRVLARLADRIFESLDYDDSKKFSIDYLKAIMPGSDLSGVWDKLALWGLIDKKYGVINFAKKDSTKKVIQDVADLYKRKISGEVIERGEWFNARSVAYAYAAEDVAVVVDAYEDAYAYAAEDARKKYRLTFSKKLISLLKSADK